MIRYVLVLLLIDGYGRGLGNPVPNTNNGNIADSLLELAKHCENPALSSIITEKRTECNISAQQAQSEAEFQCLLFYDINRQLCSKDKLVVQDNEYLPRIKESGNITKICAAANNWILEELPEYSVYKPALTKILSKRGTCSKFCASPDLFDDGANFFCKYYDWGYEKLQSMKQEQSAPKENTSTTLKNESITNKDTKTPEKPMLPTIKAPQIVNNTGNKSQEKPIAIEGEDEGKGEEKTVGEIKPDPSALESEKPASSPKKDLVIDEEKQDTEQGIDGLPLPNANTEDKNPDVAIPNAAADDPLVETEVEKPGTDGEGAKKDVVPKPKPINQEPDDYQDPDNLDSEELKDDIQSQDDAEDSIVEEKPNPVKPKQSTNTVKRIETPLASIEGQSSQRDVLPNMPDYPDDDDENFYAIFLTAVVLLIILYVIYHNKSKVTKVVLGLIVEGRQPGRRRNSRGHAYRRLDTLEQAMNTNTAAAPSKIIY